MPVGAYKRPPITEAVIDIQFTVPVSDSDVSRLQRRLAKTYPLVENRLTWNVAFGPGTLQVNQAPAGVKLSTRDGLDIVIIYQHGISNSRLAPYNNWDTFRQRAYRVYTVCMKILGYHAAKRLGVRYINRLDIPSKHIQLNDWVRLAISLPAELPPALTNFGMHTSLMLPNGVHLNLHSATVDFPLLDHSSLLLDIDVYVEASIPNIPADLWALIDTLRTCKNSVFESCITDRARELFDSSIGA